MLRSETDVTKGRQYLHPNFYTTRIWSSMESKNVGNRVYSSEGEEGRRYTTTTVAAAERQRQRGSSKSKPDQGVVNICIPDENFITKATKIL